METSSLYFNIYSQTEYSLKKFLMCIWWDQLLKQGEKYTGALYPKHLMRFKEKRANYYFRHDERRNLPKNFSNNTIIKDYRRI